MDDATYEVAVQNLILRTRPVLCWQQSSSFVEMEEWEVKAMPAAATKHILKDWIVEALSSSGGSAHHVDVAKHIWATHQTDLQSSGDLFYTWQYDMRWAADDLRREGKLLPKPKGDQGPWQLASSR